MFFRFAELTWHSQLRPGILRAHKGQAWQCLGRHHSRSRDLVFFFQWQMDANLKTAKPEEIPVNSRGTDSPGHLTHNHPGNAIIWCELIPSAHASGKAGQHARESQKLIAL